jgi:hypothetical protein
MKKLMLLVLVLSLSTLAFAGSETIDFEQYAQFTQITNQYSAMGVTFDSALQLVAPNYDYFDFPAHSGNGVITDDPSSTITMTFAAGFAGSAITGWFNAPAGMTATAYDSLGHVLATFTGTTTPGITQEFSLSGLGYIAKITFDDGGGGDTLTLDDLSWTPIPEPSSVLVMGSGLLTFGTLLRRKLAMRRN